MNKKYDVSIIGAGIGGLVCGCYLVRKGYKVIIFDQHERVGGCCGSFERNGYTFDVGVHSLGSLREEGILFKIFSELDVLKEIDFLRSHIVDRVMIPDHQILIFSDSQLTKEELIREFPLEKGKIEDFFGVVVDGNFQLMLSLAAGLTFDVFLDKFFENYDLKAILKVFLASIGLPSTQASAVVALVLFREFVFDGGYYPSGGMQSLPNALLKRFLGWGGEIATRSRIHKISVVNGIANGVYTSKEEFYNSRFIVSCCDSWTTFNEMIATETEEKKRLEKVTPSKSAFVVYLGLKRRLLDIPPHFATWLFETKDIDWCYTEGIKAENLFDPKYLLLTFPGTIDKSVAPKDKSILRVFVGANYNKNEFWEVNKELIADKIISKVVSAFPGVKSAIEITVAGSPATFNRYTHNKCGALFGLAATPGQIKRNFFPSQSSVKNLFLAGHWVTSGMGQSGIATVAYSGKTTANIILRRSKR